MEKSKSKSVADIVVTYGVAVVSIMALPSCQSLLRSRWAHIR